MSQKQTSQLLAKAKALGCTVTLTHANHYKIRTPGGQTVVIPSTPSDSYRGYLNNRAQLRRAGVAL